MENEDVDIGKVYGNVVTKKNDFKFYYYLLEWNEYILLMGLFVLTCNCLLWKVINNAGSSFFK